ncbi:hypothetical protein [Microvirga tunisiensis]|uniref:DUF1819 family protein n=1 Tax=Microvirga tunisiensis TaxID=2108360 RepID=A0A5N7MBE3_9HYPH|nr:hypothetical protein [Microvirga tunisiensis]MPR06291.1 hypothetical protein [Microvirga tunisiensis]MPR24077.1 hypothetical protein [Microvirga tunisiensis]
MSYPVTWSQRLLRKGAFAEETHRLFSEWSFDETVKSNLDRLLGGNFNTVGWEKEVRTTVGARLRHIERMKPLIFLAQGSMPFHDWRDCLRLWITATEDPFRSFVFDWLDPEREKGRQHVRSEDVRPFVTAAWTEAGKPALSEYGVMRTARDLLKTAGDLGLLTGSSAVKAYRTPVMSDDAMIFHVHMIADLEGTPSRVVDSVYWRSAFMSPSDVHATLLRLHQYRRLDYQVAGSLVQLTLPYGSASEYAKAMAA